MGTRCGLEGANKGNSANRKSSSLSRVAIPTELTRPLSQDCTGYALQYRYLIPIKYVIFIFTSTAPHSPSSSIGTGACSFGRRKKMTELCRSRDFNLGSQGCCHLCCYSASSNHKIINSKSLITFELFIRIIH